MSALRASTQGQYSMSVLRVSTHCQCSHCQYSGPVLTASTQGQYSLPVFSLPVLRASTHCQYSVAGSVLEKFAAAELSFTPCFASPGTLKVRVNADLTLRKTEPTEMKALTLTHNLYH